jgi:ferredoxin-like protein FixX
MDIKIKKIKIENFKKVKQFELELENANVNIYGDNETGKTTLADAFTWCLFGKNSQWLSDTNFKIRPLAANGEPIHHVEIMVELTLLVDDQKLELKRVLKEVYKKSRETLETSLAGNETEFYVNQVPKPKKEYQTIIDGLISEDLFKALTSPTYFNNSIDWKERRNTLFKLVNQISYKDILATDKKLAILEPEFDVIKSEDEIKTKWLAIKNKTERDIKDIPVRIDELLKTDYSEVSNLKNDLNLKSKIVTLHNAIYDLKNANKDEKQIKLKVDLKDKALTVQDEIREIAKASEEVERSLLIKQEQEIRNAREKDNIAINAKTKLERELENTEYDQKKNNARIEELALTKATLLEEYKKIKARELDFNATKCFNCGQDLPKEKMDQVLETFNQTKVRDLNANIEKGKLIMQELEDLKTGSVAILENAKRINGELEKINASHEPIEAIIESIKAKYNAKIEEERKALETRVSPFKNELESLNIRIANLTSEDKENANEGEIEALETKLEKTNVLISKYAQYIGQKARIAELQAEEDRLLIALEQANNIILALDRFIEIKANKIEKDVNAHFGIVKFKLFEKNLNGSIENTCVATVNGVPFNDLNHAMQINAGLDIINTLQKIYDIKAPIWVDNAEAITRYIAIDSQLIKLYVKEDAKNLHFEIEDTTKESDAPETTATPSVDYIIEDEDKIEDEELIEEDAKEEVTTEKVVEQLKLF